MIDFSFSLVKRLSQDPGSLTEEEEVVEEGWKIPLSC